MNVCLYCGVSVKNLYCGVSCQNRHNNVKIKNNYNQVPKLCLCCNIPIIYEKRRNEFCSSSCSAIFGNKNKILTDSQKNKTSLTLKNYYEKHPDKIRRKIRCCEVCLKEISLYRKKSKYCSVDCMKINRYLLLSVAGRKASQEQSRIRRSKGEIYFAELCLLKFDNVKVNECIFNGWDADIIIEELKIAVLYNGAWHYKKITKKHSVEQVQNRDKIKISEIIKTGYTPYIVKDLGKFNKDFVETEFNKFVNYIETKHTL